MSHGNEAVPPESIVIVGYADPRSGDMVFENVAEGIVNGEDIADAAAPVAVDSGSP